MKQAITKATEELLAIYLNKGVQVSDLAENMFDCEYHSFAISRNINTVVATLSFVEMLEDSKQTITMRYTYSADQFLQTVEQKISSSRYVTQWCRQTAVADAVAKLTLQLKRYGYTDASVDGAMSSLPEDLVVRLRNSLKAVA
ncbi:hypothetical protein [Pseudomonas monteilii]|uniref:hypothetical protein n=1 Tax=Pseudomonas monteilii TaxID=76759 RepID=UPI0018D71ACB|nr:hypothetical protein [Pseudomonas monteilii]MBH3395834.1 hypothetical protein [Pseudomonas monteilii]